MSEQSESVLKVTDRRHFTESGERREGVEPSVFTPPPEPVAPAAAASPAMAAEKAPDATPRTPPPPRPERLAAREITFLGLLQDLYATAMMQLGAELQPGQPGRLDLEGARETIDLIGLLQQKTHGNLDAKETSLLANILYDLRLNYVEVMRAATRLPPPPGAKKR